MTDLHQGLTVYVARVARLGDCSNDGVSARFDKLTVVGVLDPETGKVTALDEHSRVFAATDTAPAVAMRRGNVSGTVVIEPVAMNMAGTQYVREHRWTMFGGNYATLLDSRLCRLAEELCGHRFYGAVAVHDRVES